MSFLRYFPVLICFGVLNASAETVDVFSPDKRTKLSVTNSSAGLNYKIERDGKVIIAESSMGLAVDNVRLGSSDMKLLSSEKKSVKDSYKIVAGSHQSVADHYQSIKLEYVTQVEPQKYSCACL